MADATRGVACTDSRRVEGATGHVRKRLDSTHLHPAPPLIIQAMTPLQTPPTDDVCYLAFKARDARFDGCFFTGVTSTGIYCRPVCHVRTAKRENCRFFAYAAQAEQAGFRPCLRCRPELAPRAPALAHSPESRVWSMQDASSILALQAARLLEASEAWGPGAPALQQLALRLGVSDRHLRRIFNAQFGVSPLHYLQTQRLLRAKQLLTDTTLAVTQVAALSGFASVRRFNAAFVRHYRLNPSALRRSSAQADGAPPRRTARPSASQNSVTVRLGYRPPFDTEAIMHFFKSHVMAGSEFVTTDPATGISLMGMTCRLPTGNSTAANHRDGAIGWATGWLSAWFDTTSSQLVLQVSDSLCVVLPDVIRCVRDLFDLDAEPAAINQLLHAPFPTGDGLRVPGALSGFELAVRAILGQQITVAAARTVAQRLVTALGEPIETPWPALNRVFPAPAQLRDTSAERSNLLGGLGIIRQRQAAIAALAQAVASGQLVLGSRADVPTTVTALKALPGVGDWTAQYIAMRALRWPDAFPAGDVALHKTLGVQGHKHPARLAEAASTAWKPWRSYAVIRVWSGAWRGPDKPLETTAQ